MADDLYDRDVLTWSERQADLLRRLAAGERLNEAIDWINVIEEIESVGRSELHRCESFLLQALIHLLKLAAWPESRAARHWRAEITGFLDDAHRDYVPSMRQRFDLDDIYASARRRVSAAYDDTGPALPLPPECPFTLDDLVGSQQDVSGLCAKLSAAANRMREGA